MRLIWPGSESLDSHVAALKRGWSANNLRPEASSVGLRHVDITTEPENLASRRVIEANGAELLGPFTKPAQFGGGLGLKYRIVL